MLGKFGALAAAFLLLSAPSSRAQSNSPAEAPTLSNIEPSGRSYEDLIKEYAAPGSPASPDQGRRDIAEQDWRSLQDRRTVSVSRFTYPVDGLQISGIVVQPANESIARPVLIWARGGIGAITIGESQLAQMVHWAKRGYLVLASNYRGGGSGVGRDEFAGADVNDILELARLAPRFRGADPNRMYAIGFSRGGLMLFKAVADGLPVRAFVTVGGLTDLAEISRERPPLDKAFREMMPDYVAESANRFCRRSAICWPERLKAPVMLAHGGNDQVIPSKQALQLASALEVAKRDYLLWVVGGADHGLNGRRMPLFDAAHAFFKAHGAATVPQ